MCANYISICSQITSSEKNILSKYQYSIDVNSLICQGQSLTPLSTIFQLYSGSRFDWWQKLEYPEKTTDLPQVTDKLICPTEAVIIRQYCYLTYSVSPYHNFDSLPWQREPNKYIFVCDSLTSTSNGLIVFYKKYLSFLHR